MHAVNNGRYRLLGTGSEARTNIRQIDRSITSLSAKGNNKRPIFPTPPRWSSVVLIAFLFLLQFGEPCSCLHLPPESKRRAYQTEPDETRADQRKAESNRTGLWPVTINVNGVYHNQVSKTAHRAVQRLSSRRSLLVRVLSAWVLFDTALLPIITAQPQEEAANMIQGLMPSGYEQGDFRGQQGTKRARTDGAVRGEGDWTCPQCGNVNFAFRTTCNMRKCGASKPAEGAQRAIGGSMAAPTMYEQAPAPMYMGGPGAPPPLPLALPASYGTPMPIAPQAVTSTVPYDYGASVNTVQPYQPMPMAASYGPPGAVIGGGPGYGTGPVMDGYGMSMGMGRVPSIAGPRGGPVMGYGEENGSRKRRGGPDGFSEGDWVCPKCGNTNFAFRTTCNMRKCGAPKPSEPANRYGNGPATRAPATQGPPPDGSWTCEACGNVNYPFRTKCNRRNCGADKPTELKQTANSSSPLPSEQ